MWIAMPGSLLYRALLVDDEEPARDELKHLLAGYPAWAVCGEADGGRAALEMAASLRPDVTFLDIQMRGLSGCEVARRMLALPCPPLIVFVTAYDRYAVEAFELGAVDYLLKPFGAERLAQTMARLQFLLANPLLRRSALERTAEALEHLLDYDAKTGGKPAGRPEVKKLPVERAGRITLIDYREIVYARSSGGTTKVCTAGELFNFPGTLYELTERLSTDNSFFRVHKSYLVNLHFVREVIPWFKGTYWVVMADKEKTQVPVSKARVKALKGLLGLD
jgi:two-component system LytT family response regulator/two-component system response regulator LytT